MRISWKGAELHVNFYSISNSRMSYSLHFCFCLLIKKKKLSLQDLRRKYAGSVPLPTQEKFAKSMMALQEDRKKMEDDLLSVS